MTARGRTAAVIGVFAVIVAAAGTATAARGRQLILGAKNTASKPTVLRDTNGTALVLTGKRSKPPFTVHGNTTVVPSLDASLLGGLSAQVIQGVVKEFTTAGTFQVTVPIGVHHAMFTAVGGGGGGGGGSFPGAAGGQGGYAVSWAPVRPGQKLTVIVGAAGRGGASGADGTSGGSSEVKYGAGTDQFYDEAQNGGPGVAGQACPASSDGGVAGQGIGASAGAQALGARNLEVVDGVPGSSGSWSGAQKCPAKSRHRGSGVGTGFAGASGSGGNLSTTATDGQAGLVIVEFLR